MKSAALLATFTWILFAKIINGQQNNLLTPRDFEINNILSQKQPTNGLVSGLKKSLSQNDIPTSLPNNLNQYQAQKQTNAPVPLPSTQTLQLPPDLQQQNLQVHHYLEFQTEPQIKAPQQTFQAQQLASHHTPLHPQQSTSRADQPALSQQYFQPQQPSQLLQALHQQHSTSQPDQPALSQQSFQPQQPLQLQQALQPQQHLLSRDPLQLKQPVQLQQQSLQLQQPQLTIQAQHSSQPQQLLQTQQALQAQQPVQPFVFEQNSSPPFSVPALQQQINYQSNPQIQFAVQSSNPPTIVNAERSLNSQNHIFQPQQNYNPNPAESIANSKLTSNTPQEIPSIKYQIASQPSISSPLNPPVGYNAIAIVPSYNIKPVEHKLIPDFSYHNNINIIPETQKSLAENNRVASAAPTLLSVPSIPNTPMQNINPHTYYYNQQPADQLQNVYVNQNPVFRYNQQSQLPVTTVHSHTATSIPSQSPIVTSYPVSLVQAPSLPVIPQYTATSYPVNTIMAPTYTTQKTKPSNFKSILPIIFNLLKEKIASGGCSDCPCECKNKTDVDNKLEVSCGYSSQKNYGALNEGALSVLNAVSEETDGAEWLRERKNCLENRNITLEASSETVEEEDSEEVDGDDDAED